VNIGGGADRTQESHMLGNLVNRVRDQGNDAPATRVAVPPPRPTMDRPTPKTEAAARLEAAMRPEPVAKPEMISSIGSGMSMTGTIVCDGPMQIHGRVEGELRATEILIGDSAHVEGNIVAQELIIRGSVKGTIRALRVKLQGNGSVAGDIFHRSLAIEENAQFEGSSHRVENPMESAAPAPAAQAASSGTSPSSSSGTPSRAQLKLKPNLDALAQVPPATMNTISG
jgi:cytoskeletal protein CcmA (bactofilin family)